MGSLKLVLRNPAHLLGGQLEAVRVGAADHSRAVDGDLVAVLEKEEGGHGGDAVLARHGLDVVDVDLGEGEVVGDAVLLGPLRIQRRDLLARSAPVGVEVGNDVLRRSEEGVELGLRGDVLDGVGHFGKGFFFLGKGLEGERRLSRVEWERRGSELTGTVAKLGRCVMLLGVTLVSCRKTFGARGNAIL